MEDIETKIEFTGFEKQIGEGFPLTEDKLETLKSKTVSSGREIKAGDFVLFGLEESETPNKEGEIYYTLITLTQDEIEKYDVTPNKSMIPKLKLKNK